MTSFTQSARSLFPPAPGPNAHKLAPSPASRQNFDYTTASIYTDEHRANANMEFLNICLLLTHYSPDFTLYDVVHCCCCIPPAQKLFPRKPCKHAHREILAYLDACKPSLLLHSGRTYLVNILFASGIDFHQAYHGAFFTQQFFNSLLNVGNWAVSPHAHPSHQSDAG
jgi:hypothetical protein